MFSSLNTIPQEEVERGDKMEKAYTIRRWTGEYLPKIKDEEHVLFVNYDGEWMPVAYVLRKSKGESYVCDATGWNDNGMSYFSEESRLESYLFSHYIIDADYWCKHKEDKALPFAYRLTKSLAFAC